MEDTVTEKTLIDPALPLFKALHAANAAPLSERTATISQ